ncbi:MAG: hypothetical protein NC321_12900 [Clostridium sp.]|nr:hypothetical protein [Clostridium sp.]
MRKKLGSFDKVIILTVYHRIIDTMLSFSFIDESELKQTFVSVNSNTSLDVDLFDIKLLKLYRERESNYMWVTALQNVYYKSISPNGSSDYGKLVKGKKMDLNENSGYSYMFADSPFN